MNKRTFSEEDGDRLLPEGNQGVIVARLVGQTPEEDVVFISVSISSPDGEHQGVISTVIDPENALDLARSIADIANGIIESVNEHRDEKLRATADVTDRVRDALKGNGDD